MVFWHRVNLAVPLQTTSFQTPGSSVEDSFSVLNPVIVRSSAAIESHESAARRPHPPARTNPTTGSIADRCHTSDLPKAQAF